MTDRKPKILIYDLETAPCLGWFWRTGRTVLGSNQILRPGKIICVSYRFSHWKPGVVKSLKWKPKKRTNRFSYRFSDKDMVIKFAEIAKQADFIVGHNGDSFDKKTLNSRLAYYDIQTLIHVDTEDTLKQSRQQFNLPSHKLDFLCKYFNIPGKLSTVTGLWQKVAFDESKAALKEMVKYCDNDVLILQKLYDKIYPHVKHKFNMNTFLGTRDNCPQCGSDSVHKHNKVRTKTGLFQKFRCKGCGHIFRDGINLLTNTASIRR